MTITIGGDTLKTAVPADLNDRLVNATGASVADHVQILKGRGVTPFQVARALQPLLASPVPLHELVKKIAASDVRAIRLDVAALLVSKATQEDANGDAA